ncbi:MAG TPA: enoyl-CoA hydratase/isomerase family protein [Solirubrobacteraceae bacterium]|jgi:enoyl-CoA hydratase/carnithine racemase
MPSLTRQDDVFILDLGDDENRFNPDWVGAVNALLDEVEAAPLPRALVSAAQGKIFSNGLDLEWLAANLEQANAFLTQVHELFARVLTFGVPTVAALQGHTFAAGAMLAVAHDQRVMRADRGYFCLPEADINIPFSPGMSALIMARLPIGAAHEAMTTGRRYGGGDALSAGIVNAAVPEEQVLPQAIALAASQASKDPATLATIKERMYAGAVAALRDVAANSISLPG